MTEQAPQYLEYTRIVAELADGRRLLARGDFEGARIAAWAARQLATTDFVLDLVPECDELLDSCDKHEDDWRGNIERASRGA